MSQTFPYLEVSGTHRELGLAIGKKFQNNLARRLKQRRSFPAYREYLDRIDPFLFSTRKYFPQLIEEMEGVAAGAKIPFKDIFLFNTSEIHAFYLDRISPAHCTIAVAFTPDGPVVGHNEDWPPNEDAINDLYILKATIEGVTFLGLHYATELPGTSAAMNSFGLVQCINSLYSDSRIGVPKNFVARAILECRTLEGAEKLIRKIPRASGFNHVLIQGHQVHNLECATQNFYRTKLTDRPYAHTNHFLHPKMRPLEKMTDPWLENSQSRLLQAKSLAARVRTREDMQALLSDTNHQKYPICRPDETIGSVVLLPAKKEVWVCRSHPCAGKYFPYRL